MRRELAGAVLVWFGGFAVVLAQETTSGSIAGKAADAQGGGLPGADVTLSSGQGERTVVTDGRGRFLVPYLTPGRYDVRVELLGFKTATQHGVLVRLGQRVELPFTLEIGDIMEMLEVTAASTVVDMSSTTAGGILATDELLRLPAPRRLTETLYMVPGVSGSTGTGDANPSIAGASGLDNQYVVDGVNITNQGFGGIGVYTVTFGSLGTGVTTDFIQETQVKTAGFEAEYGQATGGVVNVITKSGTNAFHGSLFGYWRPPGLESDWRQQQTELGQVNTTEMGTLDFGVSVGGPLLQDRLFYFAAFNPQYETRTLIAPEGFPLEELGEVNRKRRSLSYAGKLTWQMTNNHRLDLTLFGDPSHGAPGPQRGDALAAEGLARFSSLDSYGGHNQALRYNGVLSSTWLLEATVAHARTFHNELPVVDEWHVRDFSVFPFANSGGLGSHEAGTDGRNLQLALISTNFLAGGAHELRYGIQLENIEFTGKFNFTGPSFTFPDGVPSRTGVSYEIIPDAFFGGDLGNIYRVNGFRGPRPVSTQSYLSWFAQDTFRLGARLTLRPGIRWERQRLVGGGDPLCFSDESSVGAGDGTPGNEIPCAYTWTNNWGPRIGATFDLTGNGRSKLYGSWGRFFAKIPNGLAVGAMSGAASAVADYFDAELTQLVPDGVLAIGTRTHFRVFDGGVATFANDSRLTYHDELVAGFEFEAAPFLNLGVRYIHRSLPRILEDYAQAQPLLYDLGFEGLTDVHLFIDNIRAGLETLDPTSIGVPQAFFEDPVHKYEAIEVTATKTYSDNWSLLASYRWSRLRGNFEGFYRSDNGQSGPAITTLFDFPTNDISYTQIGTPEFGYQGDIRYQGTTLGMGRLPNDRTHQLKIYGAYTWGDLDLGLGFRAGTGQPLTALAANPIYGNRGEIPETVRGGGFETEDGFKTRAPSLTLVDLHVGYTIRLGGTQRLVLVADVFNVLNDRDPVTYRPFTEVRFGVPDPDVGSPFDPARETTAFWVPRHVRLGARFEW